jgi:tyrosinase
MAYYVIEGRKGTGVHDRLEIETLQAKEPRQFALFILSFLAIQGQKVKLMQDVTIKVPDAATFAELAGIHGRPRQVIL